MSNKLIDILDDEKKVDKLNEDYHYRQSVLPRLKQLRELIRDSQFHSHAQIENLDFVKTLIEDLKDTPQHRVTSLEMKECNKLWKKYKD